MHLIPELALTLFEIEYVKLISPPMTGVPSEEYELVLVLHDAAALLFVRCRMRGAGVLDLLYLWADSGMLGESEGIKHIVAGEAEVRYGHSSEEVRSVSVTRGSHAPQLVRNGGSTHDLRFRPGCGRHVKNLKLSTAKCRVATIASPHV